MTSTASSEGGPAGRSAARGNREAGPYCIEPRTRPSSSRYTVPHAPHSSSARSIHFRFSASRFPRLCHQTHAWQTDGAVSRVAPVSPASREVIASRAARRRAPRRRRRSRRARSPCARCTRRRAAAPRSATPSAAAPHASSTWTSMSMAPVGARDLRRVAREAGDALHLERRITRVAREHVVRDDRGFHYADRTTSSVTSGRAKRRNGTKVVPSPGETCSRVARTRRRPRRRARAGARAADARRDTGRRSARRGSDRRGSGGTPPGCAGRSRGSGRAGCGGPRLASASSWGAAARAA